MIFLQINFFAVLVAAVVAMIVGAIWYGPLFGKLWMNLVGMSEAEMNQAKKGMIKSYAVSFVSLLLMSLVLALVFLLFNVKSILGGLVSSFIIWLGFVATTHLVHYLYEDRPIKLYLLTIGHHLAELLTMGAILVYLSELSLLIV